MAIKITKVQLNVPNTGKRGIHAMSNTLSQTWALIADDVKRKGVVIQTTLDTCVVGSRRHKQRAYFAKWVLSPCSQHTHTQTQSNPLTLATKQLARSHQHIHKFQLQEFIQVCLTDLLYYADLAISHFPFRFHSSFPTLFVWAMVLLIQTDVCKLIFLTMNVSTIYNR